MDDRAKVAHHEAAHAVLAVRAGVGVSGGIDLDAPISVDGAFGNAAVNLLVLDATLPDSEQRMDLVRNLTVICAGAASDARVSRIDPVAALHAQPGDFGLALEHAETSAIVGSAEEAEEVVTNIALEHSVRLLEKPEVWAAVERVATAVLAAGGKLDADQIEALGAIEPVPRCRPIATVFDIIPAAAAAWRIHGERP